MRFKVGDKVKWWSQSSGWGGLKIGEIVLVVPEDRSPSPNLLREDFPDCSINAMKNPGMGRDHESYIVRVPSGTKAKDKLYWPRVSKLELVHPF